eukprot:6826150-Pyramimonas_sp.AAC.1
MCIRDSSEELALRAEPPRDAARARSVATGSQTSCAGSARFGRMPAVHFDSPFRTVFAQAHKTRGRKESAPKEHAC